MLTALDLISGICWSVVYITAIVVGIKQKTWCLPKLAICQNFAWELWIVLDQIASHAPWRTGFMIQIVWLILDIGILLSWLWYDRNRIRSNIFLLCSVLTVIYLLSDYTGHWEILAFLINAVMSALFLVRFKKKPGPWVSSTIAGGKLIGTLANTIICGVIYHDLVILWLGGLCFVFDMSYLLQVYQYLRGT